MSAATHSASGHGAVPNYFVPSPSRHPAMAALGLTTHMSALRQAGLKPMLLAALLFIWLIVGGAGINQVVQHLFG